MDSDEPWFVLFDKVDDALVDEGADDDDDDDDDNDDPLALVWPAIFDMGVMAFDGGEQGCILGGILCRKRAV